LGESSPAGWAGIQKQLDFRVEITQTLVSIKGGRVMKTDRLKSLIVLLMTISLTCGCLALIRVAAAVTTAW
jgi:hypothetical protein